MGQNHEYPNMTDTFELILNTNTLRIDKGYQRVFGDGCRLLLVLMSVVLQYNHAI